MLEANLGTPKRITLKGLEIATHYAMPIFLTIPTVTWACLKVTGHFGSVHAEFIRAYSFWTVGASVFLVWFQTRALRFRVFQTSRNAHENYVKVTQAITKTNWTLVFHSIDSRLIATSPGAASWGERIEVRFDGSNVYVNSICDPRKHASLIAFGDNLDNIRFVQDAIVGI